MKTFVTIVGLLGCFVAATSACLSTPASPAPPSPACNKCNPKNKAACISETTIMVCNDKGVPTGNVIPCIGDSVCVSDPKCGVACMPRATYAAKATCPAKPQSAAAYCADKKQGYYPVGDDAKTTCRQYYYCVQKKGGPCTGNLYVCPNNLYYNRCSEKCVKEIPKECSAKV